MIEAQSLYSKGQCSFFERETRNLPFFVLFYSSEVLYTLIFLFFVSWLMKYFFPPDSSTCSSRTHLETEQNQQREEISSDEKCKQEMKEEEEI
jgi:hypothetical protein